ncbi:DUF397 domain-containing protein [Actinoplanes utahensis]|uniref:DUF397 domain-containing protein n=1 Tax=Actinoplanes utahensis TaxID=1869 RepID=A0A0A6UB07_ACTUT|nr:DUF397 domain-containing protein [Actinoplanes utahensis]KHD72238.1 hypothetical protein MB27_41310 [Actinoplanes utahensis]GIF27670.1 hypothetical protein Aut01nite_06560 [Actinoplanes utahensis]
MRDTTTGWQRSTFCSTGACVEVAVDGAAVALRDSKNPEQAPLVFTLSEWDGFQELVLQVGRSR